MTMIAELRGETTPPTGDTPHPLLAERWSPRAYDPSHTLDDASLRRLLEAARWAPSSLNRQPWRFVVARRGESRHQRIVETLSDFNQRWAPKASALVVGVVEADDPARLPTATYGLGLAVSQLTLQAEAEGLRSRQMGGFDAAALGAVLGVPDNFEPFVVVAVGEQSATESPDAEVARRDRAPRVRRALAETAFAEWGEPHPVAA